jgi:hypothetical protein
VAGKLIQIYYAEEQKAHCFPFADLHFNERLTIFFENEPISRLVMASEDEKLAVCSWKLRQKLRWYIGKPRELTQEVLNSDYEVLSMTKNSHHHQMLASADRHHKGFKVAFQKICDHIGLKVPGEVKIPIYQNHFSAKIEIYRDYVSNFLKPAMDFMTNDEEMNRLAMADSNYSQLSRNSASTSEYLQQQIGVPYYPLSPFLLERLFSVYVQNKKIKVTHL